MASIAYALSIQHFINTVGAKAGFAAIIGLALLVLLFFTQSRETANLRRRADEAEQQLYQLQLHLDHLSRQRAHQTAPAAAQTTGAPVAAPPAAARLARPGATRAIPGEQVAEGGGVATLIPAAPAGVGAPALSSATRLIPLAEPDEISIRALRPSTNGDGGDHVSDATVATPPPSMATPPPAPPPSTAAGGGNGVARAPVPVPMPTMAATAEPAPPPRVALPRQQQRPPARPPVSPPRRGGQGPGRRISPVFFILAGVLAAAAVAVVLIFVTGSGNSTSSSSSSSSAAAASSTNAGAKSKGTKQHKGVVTEVTPSSVTVAVLNGTSTDNLAADVLSKLTTVGYKGGTKQNAAESGVTSTIVGYTAPTYRSDALAVAKSLNLGPASVQGVSQGDRAKVCGGTSACTTQVVVTAGTDLAQTG
ncbi:MAG TPA: LytR C-terminal domain-containing protein [Solirubrobacteraceae bacterium]|nr:LytR C-terminal domain-containing protein [Solirubrobacteraceae bacterium]